MKLEFDDRVGSHNRASAVDQPRWEQVAEAIARLDGSRHTEVVLSSADAYLTVGGGPDRFLVFIYTADETSLVAEADVASGRDEEKLVVGGQVGRFPASQLVGAEAALKAARSFFEGRGPSHDLRWVRQQ